MIFGKRGRGVASWDLALPLWPVRRGGGKAGSVKKRYGGIIVDINVSWQGVVCAKPLTLARTRPIIFAMANISGSQADVQFCQKCKGTLRNAPRHEMKSNLRRPDSTGAEHTHTSECTNRSCKKRFEIDQDR